MCAERPIGQTEGVLSSDRGRDAHGLVAWCLGRKRQQLITLLYAVKSHWKQLAKVEAYPPVAVPELVFAGSATT